MSEAFSLQYCSPVAEAREDARLRNLADQADELDQEAQDLRDEARGLEEDARTIRKQAEELRALNLNGDDIVVQFAGTLLWFSGWLSGAAIEAVEDVIGGDGAIRRLIELAQNYGFPWPIELLELAKIQEMRGVR